MGGDTSTEGLCQKNLSLHVASPQPMPSSHRWTCGRCSAVCNSKKQLEQHQNSQKCAKDDTSEYACYNAWVGSLAPSKVHKQKDCCKGVRELKFHPRGEVVAALNDRNQVSFYAANTGTWNFAVQNNAYGISNFEFTHHEYSLLHSTKNRKTNVVFYLSAYDNRYLRQFQEESTAGPSRPSVCRLRKTSFYPLQIKERCSNGTFAPRAAGSAAPR